MLEKYKQGQQLRFLFHILLTSQTFHTERCKNALYIVLRFKISY
jgi:hypothetical protein